jgi:hypothetical protein
MARSATSQAFKINELQTKLNWFWTGFLENPSYMIVWILFGILNYKSGCENIRIILQCLFAMEMNIFFLYIAHIDNQVQYYNMLENSLCLALF